MPRLGPRIRFSEAVAGVEGLAHLHRPEVLHARLLLGKAPPLDWCAVAGDVNQSGRRSPERHGG